jgi:Cu(I)/Ag(I) efflux system membrane protein CusA/SilA
MMTVVAIMAGLLPILWSTGAGSEVMQRIAVPMIGGMASSTILTLIVIPAIYALIKGVGLPHDSKRGSLAKFREPNADSRQSSIQAPPTNVASKGLARRNFTREYD